MKPRRHTDLKLLAEIRTLPCACCLAPPPSEVSHIKTRGSGAGDYDFNCVPSCRRCHREWHYCGPSRFFKRHPDFFGVLLYMGWCFDGKKLWHPRMQKGENR